MSYINITSINCSTDIVPTFLLSTIFTAVQHFRTHIYVIEYAWISMQLYAYIVTLV